jgi:ferredoxin
MPLGLMAALAVPVLAEQHAARCRSAGRAARAVCHACETTLVAGGLDRDPEPVGPPAEGSALICCSRPAGDVVLDL